MWGMRKAPKKYVAFNSSVGTTGAGGKERKTPRSACCQFCEVPGGIKWRGNTRPRNTLPDAGEVRPKHTGVECGGVLGSVESGFRVGLKDER